MRCGSAAAGGHARRGTWRQVRWPLRRPTIRRTPSLSRVQWSVSCNMIRSRRSPRGATPSTQPITVSNSSATPTTPVSASRWLRPSASAAKTSLVRQPSGCSPAKGLPTTGTTSVSRAPCQLSPSSGWLLLRSAPNALSSARVRAGSPSSLCGRVGTFGPCCWHVVVA